jgi:hypothetical protein
VALPVQVPDDGEHHNYQFTPGPDDPTNHDSDPRGANCATIALLPVVPGARHDAAARAHRRAAQARRPGRYHRPGLDLVRPLGPKAPPELPGAVRRAPADRRRRDTRRLRPPRARRRTAPAVRPLLDPDSRAVSSTATRSGVDRRRAPAADHGRNLMVHCEPCALGPKHTFDCRTRWSPPGPSAPTVGRWPASRETPGTAMVLRSQSG